MTPVVNGRWYATMAEGYADSPFFKGEVKGCIHKPDRFITGESCDECKRVLAEFDRRHREFWQAVDEWHALPFWKRWFTPYPASPWS